MEDSAFVDRPEYEDMDLGNSRISFYGAKRAASAARRLAVALLITCTALVAFSATHASAAAFPVNSLADTNDGICDAAPDCTLREAIFAANASGVADTITFSVVGTITLGSNLPGLISLDTIDGSTAPGFAIGDPKIEIDGSTVGVTLGLTLGSNTSLNAVVINGVMTTGGRGIQLNSNNVVTGCFVGTDIDGMAIDANLVGVWVGGSGNTIGGPTVASRNVISGNTFSGIEIASPSPTNIVTGNYIGTNAAGNGNVANLSEGVLMSANAQVGVVGDPPNLISGNTGNGITVGGGVTSGVIENNLIGTDASGDAALGNGQKGIEVQSGAEVTIGGATPGAGNVISASLSSCGITLDNATTTIQRNRIGTSDDGSNALGNNCGISLENGSDSNVIGSGTDPSLGNTIANNEYMGIGLDPTSGGGNDLRGNSIFNNAYGTPGMPAIDIDWSGTVTPNDLGDSDVGANDVQNYPTISQVTPLPQSNEVSITGTLNSQPSSAYSIEFYANPSCDETGAGEGAIVLGSQTVGTDGSGDSSFSVQLPAPPVGNNAISATATNTGGSTSEFALCVNAATSSPPPPQPVTGESVVVTPVSGTVLVKLPGTNTYVPLESLKAIPVGSIVDARKGRVKLTVASGDTTQSADFYDGRFKVTQSKGAKPITDLKLLDHASGCGARSSSSGRRASSSKKKKKKKKSGQLWGDGSGDYRTTGDNGSATVRGTKWQTVNRCDGTLFYVKRGVVKVRDFHRKKTITLRAGQKYLAKAG